MNYDLHTLIVTAIISSLIGGSLGGYIVRAVMKNAAKEALKEDLDKIDEDIERLQKNYVSCAVCNAKHKSVDTTLLDINHKLDLLLEIGLKNRNGSN